MSNRPRNAVKWSETIQVSVSNETKNQVVDIASTKGKSLSNVARELLILGLERELSQDD
tara:strand:- start:685 stop:861 length:177 start_codon:yes stop_codon:yes gene_type:complete